MRRPPPRRSASCPNACRSSSRTCWRTYLETAGACRS